MRISDWSSDVCSSDLSSVGSDTLANLMTLWAENYKKEYPNVNIQIQAAGSSTAPPALTEGTSNLGPMSRKMKDNELQAFEQKYGYKPTAIPVAKSEEHTSELQSLMRISYAVFCLKTQTKKPPK